MFEKLKNMFENKDKKIENLVSFLIILIITLIVINKILKNDEMEKVDYENTVGVELALKDEKINYKENDDNLEKRLENILSKISGVGKVYVLLTYTESSSLVPIYNVNSSTSILEEKDNAGISKITETENIQKDVVLEKDGKLSVEKRIKPLIEGAIIIAEGASNINIKSDIISAVEAVTGVKTHKIQVFEMEE